MKKINKFWLLYILFVVLLVGLCVFYNSDTAHCSQLYVTYPTVEEVETQLSFFDFGSNTQEQSYYREFDNYNYLILNSYNVDENNEPNYEDLKYTRIYFFPDFLYPIRDITMQGESYGNKLRYVPLHNRNCYILNYGLSDCYYEEHVTQKINGNIWYTTDIFYYFYIEYDYTNNCWGSLTRKSSSSQTGVNFNVDTIKIYSTNTEVYYYQIPSGQIYWSNVGTRFIYEEMGIVCKYEEVGFIGVEDEEDKENSYLDEDIVIDLDNGNEFEYEEVTEGDDLIDSILKYVRNLWKAMLNTINNIRRLPTTIVQGVYDYIGKPVRAVYNTLIDIPYNVGLKIGEVLEKYFIPSEDYLSDRFSNLVDTFPFISSIRDSVDYIMDYMKRTAFDEPPIIEIDLSDSEGKYDYGGKVAVINLAWFARYKPYSDLILSAFFWLHFLWRLYHRLHTVFTGTDIFF